MTIILISSNLYGQTVFISEIHYDNSGSDVNEGFEITAPAGTDLSCFEIEFYNGSGGSNYNSSPSVSALSGIIPDEGCGYGSIWFDAGSLQNGAPDGIGLYNTCSSSSVQFLSYEGTITAVNGVFMGQSSVDIGVSETNSTPIGSSLFLIGTGTQYSDFTWSKSRRTDSNSDSDV